VQSKDHSPSRRSTLKNLKNVRVRARPPGAPARLLLTPVGAKTGSADYASCHPANNDFSIDRTLEQSLPANDPFFVNEGA
jgi:hypothetical protein